MSLWLTMNQTKDACIGKALLELRRLDPLPSGSGYEHPPEWLRARKVRLHYMGQGNRHIHLDSPKRCSQAISFQKTNVPKIWKTSFGSQQDPTRIDKWMLPNEIRYEVRVVRPATRERREIRFEIKSGGC